MINGGNVSYFCTKCVVIEYFGFHSTYELQRALDFFDKSRIVCREKLFEIPQSICCLNQNTENHKTTE